MRIHAEHEVEFYPSHTLKSRLTSTERMQWTLRIENIGKGMGLEGGRLRGGGALEPSKVELFRKMLLKAKHFWIGEVAIELSGKIKGGINEFEKLFEILLLRDQRILVLFISERSAQFRMMKACLTFLIIRLFRFLADKKLLWEARIGYCFKVRCTLFLSSIATQ